MHKLSATRKSTRAIHLVALVSILAWLSVSALAQQPANRPPVGRAPAGALIAGTTGAASEAEGQLKATILRFRDGNLVAEYHYYWLRGSCFIRDETGHYEPVPPDACS